MLIDVSLSQLLIIDVQDRLAKVMGDRDALIRNCTILMKAAAELSVPIVVTEQYPEGLGHTVPELQGLMGDSDVYRKVTFSCMANEEIADRLTTGGRPHTIVAGIESHVCAMQSALDLCRARRGATDQVYFVADAVDSRRPFSKTIALDRCRDAGITTVTTEMVVFEWMRTSELPSFRTLSKLIR